LRFNPKKILIIALRQIGDTLITTPLIEDVAAAWPEAEIHFLGFNASLGILEGNQHIHQFIGSSARPKRDEYKDLIRKIFRRYDLAIITQPNDRSHLFGLIAAPVRYGVVPNDAKQGWWKRFTCQHTVEVDYFNQHVITEKRKLIPNFLRRNAHPVNVTPPLAAALPLFLSQKIEASTHPCIVVHATPLGNYKRIASSTWSLVLQSLLKNHTVILTGSHAPADLDLNAELTASVPEAFRAGLIDTSGQLTFSQLSQLLQQAVLFIGVDTSISHLAAACNTPSLVLFGPTPPTNFGPWPNGFLEEQPYHLKAKSQTVGKITILQGPGECVPCRKAGCNDDTVGTSQCLQDLDAETILFHARLKLNTLT